MEAQILKAVDLIVYVGITDKCAADSAVVVQVQQSHGVGCGITVVSVGPSGVVERLSGHLPLSVTTEVLSVGRCGVIDRLCGVVGHSGTDGTSVGILRLGPHALGIEVQYQVIIQQRRIQVQSCSDTLEI